MGGSRQDYDERDKGRVGRKALDLARVICK